MKNKRLLSWFLVSIVLCGFVVSAAVIFRVSEIIIQPLNQFENILKIKDEAEALQEYKNAASSVSKDSSILFGLERNKIISEIEKNDPWIRVTNIEVKFPNKLIIKVRERYPVYFFTKTDGRTAIMDAYLHIVDESALPALLEQDFVNLSGQFNVSEEFDNFVPGDNFKKYLTESEADTSKAETLVFMFRLFAGQGDSEDAIISLISNIEFSVIPHDNMTITFRDPLLMDTSINMEIRDVSNRFAEKLAFAWEIMQIKRNEAAEIIVTTGDEFLGQSNLIASGTLYVLWIPKE